MREAFRLVNALSGFRGAPGKFSSEIPFRGGYSGRTVALTLKFEAANG